MNKCQTVLLGVPFLVTSVTACVISDESSEKVGAVADSNSVRDMKKWPFAQDSIWNMPIGDGAVYVAGNIPPATGWGMTTDPDIIVMRPDAPLRNVYFNSAGWSGADRCNPEGELMYSAPIPDDLVIPSGPGTPNNGIAILMPDGVTMKQSQPFARCETGGPATSWIAIDDVDLRGDGIEGSHGGSGMSSIGGTLRMGELRPNQSPPRHALKVNLYGHEAMWKCSNSDDCYRWPALRADGYAVGNYGGSNPALKMGALLALNANTDIASLGLETEPARLLAWTLQNYGAYVVDDTAWPVYAIETEVGPDGDFSEQFAQDWGFAMDPQSTDAPWARDMRKLFSALAVVDNNGPTSIGGGGNPRQPLAPGFGEPIDDGGDDSGDDNSGGDGGGDDSGDDCDTDPGSVHLQKVKILAMGDSITANSTSWIYPLQDLLRSDGCEYEMSGLDHQPYEGAYQVKAGYDNLRLAAGGFNTTGIRTWMAEEGFGDVPDVVVVYLGVNNVYGGYHDGHYNPDLRNRPSESYIEDISAMIDTLRSHNPNVRFILGKIQEGQLPQIDSAIDSVVATKNTTQSPVLSTNFASGVSTTDGIHPDNNGAMTMAEAFYAGVGPAVKALGVCDL